MQIDDALDKIKFLRRTYSKILDESLNSENENVIELEDTIRLVGTLEAAYNHLLAAKAENGTLYCVTCKHLPYALILMGEIGLDQGPIYTILSILTDGKIKPCSACESDKEENETIS